MLKGLMLCVIILRVNAQLSGNHQRYQLCCNVAGITLIDNVWQCPCPSDMTCSTNARNDYVGLQSMAQCNTCSFGENFAHIETVIDVTDTTGDFAEFYNYECRSCAERLLRQCPDGYTLKGCGVDGSLGYCRPPLSGGLPSCPCEANQVCKQGVYVAQTWRVADAGLGAHCFIVRGALYCMGANHFGSTGVGAEGSVWVPTLIETPLVFGSYELLSERNR